MKPKQNSVCKGRCHIIIIIIICFVPPFLYGCSLVPYEQPPSGLQIEDLLGTWEVQYSEKAWEKLVLQENEFSQEFQDQYNGGHHFKQSGKKWEIKEFPDGRTQVLLDNGKYFLLGYSLSDKLPIYNPFTGEFLRPSTQLRLEIRTDSSGELILHHLYIDADAGFPLFGREHQFFRRADSH